MVINFKIVCYESKFIETCRDVCHDIYDNNFFGRGVCPRENRK